MSRQLKSSSDRIGQLYPILVDYHGEIIDGEHRFKVDKNWRRVRMKNIKTEKDRLVARIIANNVRRSVSRKEKNSLLNKLAEIFLSGGEAPGKIAFKIAEETGMSYRWVTKYLSTKFKDNLQSIRACSAARRAARFLDDLFTPPMRKGSLAIKNYANTAFVSIIIEKSFYNEFEKDSLELGVSTELSILKALEQYHEKIRKAIIFKNNQT